jgi:hypothetical protein
MTLSAKEILSLKNIDKKHIIVVGHYGTGKTNIAVNLALDLAKTEEVCLVDCDIVNPYFRSTDNKDILEEADVKVLSPNFANTNLDTPSLPAAIYSVFSMNRRIIWDVGGDDAGAIVLGMFAARLEEQGYAMIYVTNKFRPLTETASDMEEYLRDIEANSRLKAVGIVNNSNIAYLTDKSILDEGLSEAVALSKKCDLPLLFTCVNESTEWDTDTDLYKLKIYTKSI